MMRFSRTVKTAALVGLLGLGAAAAACGPAQAARSSIRCDRDGDHCWRVVCDDEGYDCRTYTLSGYGYRNDGAYRRYYDRDGSGYYGNGYYGNGYYYNGRRRWVCDRDGDDCHWSYVRW